MDKLKQWIAFAVVGALAVLAAGWFLVISPKRHDAADLKSQAQAQDATNQTLRTTLAMLKAQAKDEPKEEAKLAAISAKIPDNPALPALIRALDKAGASSGVDVKSLSPGAATLLAPPVAAAAVSPSGAKTPTTGTVAPAGSAAAGSLASIPLSVAISGTYFQGLEFINDLEELTRALKVTGLTLAPTDVAPSADGSSQPSGVVSMSVTGFVYMASGRQPVPVVTIPKTGK